MDKFYNGKKLNQLSRFLFDSAANKFYLAILLELLSGIIGVVMSLVDTNASMRLLFAIIGFSLLAVAYVLRIQFENEYDSAETMRRQSVLNEALGWDIGKVQFSEWKQKAGKRILEKAKNNPREEDYYETNENLGIRKLLEMTQESAFYTRSIYNKLLRIIQIILFVSFGLLVFVLVVIIPMQLIPTTIQLSISYTIYLLFPLVLTSDLLEIYLKVNRIKSELFKIEEAMERISKEKILVDSEIMQLVAEYNCQVVSGIPIPKQLFHLWHDEIRDLWESK